MLSDKRKRRRLRRVTYHSMEPASFVSLWSPLRILRLPSTELTKVLGGFRGDVGEELHLDATKGFAWVKSISRLRLVYASVGMVMRG